MSWEDTFQPEDQVTLPVWTQSFEPDQPTQKIDPVTNFGNAVAKGYTQLGAGILGAGSDVRQAIGVINPFEAQQEKEFIGGGRDYAEQQYPTQPGLERWVGSTIGQNAPALLFPGGPIVSGAVGGLTGSVAGTDPRASGEQKATNAVVDTALGAGTGALLKGVFGESSALNPETKRLAAVAKDEGIFLTPGQRTGSKTKQIMEGAFSNLPFTSDIQSGILEKQASQFTKSVLRKAGIDADHATPEVIGKAYDDVGGQIGNITATHSMPKDNQFIQDVIKVQDQYGDALAPNERPAFKEWVDRLTDTNTGQFLPGKAYQETRSNLGRIAQSAWMRDPNYARAVDGLQDAMDNAIQRNMPLDKVAELQKARGQYTNIKTIMKAMNTGQETAISGHIPPSRLTQALSSNNPTGFVTGKGDLNDLARAGKQFLGNKISDSGTVPRGKMAELLQGHFGSLVPAGTIGGAAGHFGGTAEGLMGAGATLGLPLAVQGIHYLPKVPMPVLSPFSAALGGQAYNFGSLAARAAH